MKFEEIEALYYKFTLKDKLIPKSIAVNSTDTSMALHYANRQLCEFINDEMIVPKMPHASKKAKGDVNYESITLITSNKEEYDNVKGFVNHLINSGQLLKLIKDCFINNNVKFPEYSQGLKESYQTYKYLDFSKDIEIKNNKEKKKVKI